MDVGSEESGSVAAAEVFGEELASFFEGAGVAAVASLDEEAFMGKDGREMGSWKRAHRGERGIKTGIGLGGAPGG
ncbi:MAG TPA: hypothetical protein VFG14_12430 [Chthoniobacteraceae bacterium]|nr:hypothetical protein [Chthoniobacteraceae bacterium]